ncbi:MAG: YhcH/YjgK/YiaL family protein [Bacteroidia bacterium]|nr:YhcH/YjgK/YiaL family protein [Bacteroidia bacterium]
MLFDDISNLLSYSCVHEGLRIVADFLDATDLSAIEPGSTELTGGARCIVAQYDTASREDETLECHRRYIDVHVPLEGSECIGVRARAFCEVAGDYDDENDFQLLTGKRSLLEMVPGTFAVFFPDDGHMPGLPLHAPGETVRKLVFKLPVGKASA